MALEGDRDRGIPPRSSWSGTALERVAPGTPLAADIHPPRSPEDLERLDIRLQAMVTAGHPEAFGLLRSILRNGDTDPGTKAALLRAWRLGGWNLLDPDLAALLAEPLAGILR